MMMQGESGVGGVASTSVSAMLLLADFLPRATTSQKFRILGNKKKTELIIGTGLIKGQKIYGRLTVEYAQIKSMTKISKRRLLHCVFERFTLGLT